MKTENQEGASTNAKAEKTKHKWPKIRKHVVAGIKYWLIDLGMVKDKRIRNTFKTKEEAETAASLKRTERDNEGTAGLGLSAAVRADAAKASKKLAPHGVSLEAAADHYLKHVVAFQEAPVIKDMAVRMIEELETVGRREATVKDLRLRLERFSERFGDRQVTAITLAELQGWLSDPTLSARSKINYATKVSQLYNFAIKHGWAEVNLVDRISRPDPDDGEPGILTVHQAASLLNHADDCLEDGMELDLVPFIALGLFAGLRSAELARLQWSAIKLADRAIIVGSEVAKKRSRRVIEINDTLCAWLSSDKVPKGAVVNPKHFRKRFEELRKLAARALRDAEGKLAQEAEGLEKWPSNALRHSFGSYHLSMYGDAIKTAAIMGHRSVNVVHNHYKALVLKSEAERYWALRPQGLLF